VLFRSIISLTGKDISFISTGNEYLSSSYPQKIGKKTYLPAKVFSSDKPTELGQGGELDVAIPLFANNEKVGLLLIEDVESKNLEDVQLIKSLAELLIQQYLQSVAPLKDSTDQLISRIIYDNKPKDIPLLTSQASILGYRLTIPRIAVLIRLHGFREHYLLDNFRFDHDRGNAIDYWKKEIENAFLSFFTKAQDNIVSYLGEDQFVLFKDISNSDENKVIEILKKNSLSILSSIKNQDIKNITIGISRGYPGIKGLVKSFKESKLAADLGERVYGPNKSYFIDDLGVLTVIGGQEREEKINFASELLGELASNHGDYLKTLEIFFDKNLNLTDTAKKMHIHRNTVIYRLDQISHIIGLDPRNFDDAVSIKVALLIKQLFS